MLSPGVRNNPFFDCGSFYRVVDNQRQFLHRCGTFFLLLPIIISTDKLLALAYPLPVFAFLRWLASRSTLAVKQRVSVTLKSCEIAITCSQAQDVLYKDSWT